jgi:hypothetical protein
MDALPEPGISPMVDRFVNGFEGSTIAIDLPNGGRSYIIGNIIHNAAEAVENQGGLPAFCGKTVKSKCQVRGRRAGRICQLGAEVRNHSRWSPAMRPFSN